MRWWGVLLIATVVGAQTSKPLCMDDEQREQVRDLMIAGFDEALREHTKKLFDIWMRDPEAQPQRATQGMHEGVSAYIRARTSVLKWSPPKCEDRK